MKILSRLRQTIRHPLYLSWQLLLSLSLLQSYAFCFVPVVGVARTLQNIQLQIQDNNEITAVLELDGAVPQFSVVALSTPERIVVDLQGLKSTRNDASYLQQLITPAMRQIGLERISTAAAPEGLRVTFQTTTRFRYRLQRDKNSILLVLSPREVASLVRTEPAPQAAPTSSPEPESSLTQAWKRNTTPAPNTWSAKDPIVATTSNKAGKKSFAEGLKLEKKQQWDQAFQQFTVAVTAEPDNAEYRLHAQRAAQNAALQLLQKGDQFFSARDWEAAKRAYQQALTYDASSERARTQLQQIQARQTPLPDVTKPANNQITAQPVGGNDQTIYFNNANLRQVIEVMASNLGLNVLFDESFRDEPKFRLKLENISLAKALDQILLQTKHTFERTDRRTILIYQDNPQNRQRFEQLMFKTFYLSNADPNEARTLVQAVIGQQRQVLPVKHLNALVVRDTPANLQIVQELLDSIDKNRAEVLVDVDIYEVSRSTSTAIGNQIATSGIATTGTPTRTSAGLDNLGGIGLAGISTLAGQTATAGLGTIIGLPPSTLSLLKSKSNSKLLASTQIHALDGEQNQTKVGRSVPVRIGSTIVPGFGGTATGANGTNLSSFDSIQYRDVGLIIDLTPTVNNEGWVQIKMKLESSSVETAVAGANLTPSFSQRALTTIARVMDGRTAIVAGVKQETKGDSRAGIPVIGMVPILGRLFSTPQEESSLSDIIITVTPHVVRSTNIRPQDYRARIGGSFLSGVSASVEVLMQQIETEEQGQKSARTPSTIVATSSDQRSTTPAKESGLNANPPNFVTDQNNNTPQIVNLSLTPTTTSSAINESIFVAVAISSSAQISEAALALSYDPTVLQLKSIQNGALFGPNANLTPQGENGSLRFQIQQSASDAPIKAQGQLLILEFVGLKAGRTAIAFVNGDQAIKADQIIPAQFQLQNTEIEIK